MLARFFRPTPQREAAYRLYGRVVEAARRPAFFAAHGVPDTVDGRFELIALHAALVFRRLAAEHGRTKAFSQEVFDAMFADLDRSLREMGAGDLGVGKQVKRMVSAFYGRARALERGLAGAEDLEEGLRRNLYATARTTPADVSPMASWLRAADAALARQAVDGLLQGEVAFPDPPDVKEPRR